MSELKPMTCKVLRENLANYSLLEIIHHEMGNGLAVITGYTRLLCRLNIELDQQHLSIKAESVSNFLRKREFYLQAITQRETQLNDFLTHIRVLSRYPAHTRFLQNKSKIDLALLLKCVTDRLLPLYQSLNIYIRYPTQPLYVLCDPLWIDLVLEHVINHNIAFHHGSTSIKIDLACCRNSPESFQEARMGIHITKRSPKRRPVAAENIFEVWSQTLDQRDQDVCMALCDEILREHGGHLWSEQEEGQKESMYVSLPLSNEKMSSTR